MNLITLNASVINKLEGWWGKNPQIFIFIKTYNKITIIIKLQKQAESNKRAKFKNQLLSLTVFLIIRKMIKILSENNKGVSQ